jgi:Cu(I)/Ag(I) efflux system membrane fusion protein
MTKDTSPPRPRLVYAGLAITVIAGSGGYGLARWTNHDAAMPAPAQAPLRTTSRSIGTTR